MFKSVLFLLVFLCCSQFVMAQHTELSENKGEVGLMMGLASYQGDIAPDVQVYYRNYGAFAKKQLNSYVGVRLNVEMQKLASHDMLSLDPYAILRNANFQINTIEASVMGEFNFLNFISGSRNKKFTPYLGFGVGYLHILDTIRNNNTSVIVISTDDVLSGKQKQSGLNLTLPLNLGFKYNIYRKFNIFAEATYRYSTTDKLDFIDGNATPMTAAAPLGYQGSTSGNDRFFSAKLGISYSFNNIYGIAEYKPKKSIGLFKRFKRK
jgi:opacity protein-like surface antigen